MLCALTFRGHGFWFLAGPDRTPATPASHADQNRRMSKRTRGKPMSPGNDLSEEYVPLCTDLRASNQRAGDEAVAGNVYVAAGCYQ